MKAHRNDRIYKMASKSILLVWVSTLRSITKQNDTIRLSNPWARDREILTVEMAAVAEGVALATAESEARASLTGEVEEGCGEEDVMVSSGSSSALLLRQEKNLKNFRFLRVRPMLASEGGAPGGGEPSGLG